MNNYIQVTIENINSEQSDILIAQLSELGFDGFEENEIALSAFIVENVFNEAELAELIQHYNLTYSKNLIEQKNWNEEWEKNFEAVVVDDFVSIRASFHQPVKNVQHEIIITPKMSFGTGHHATTFMMIQQMRDIDFAGKSVFDFGTGTGILSILAEKLGAAKIIAIDNDEWSINNSIENSENNHCKNISLQLNDAPSQNQEFDIVLANINKNVILDHFAVLKNYLSANGHLLVSGLLTEDEGDIILAANALGLKHCLTTGKDKWIAIRFCL